MIKKIDHINVVVSNLENAKEFFAELGFEIAAESMLEGEWIERVTGLSDVRARYVKLALPNFDTNLELIQYFSPSGGHDPNIRQVNQLGYRHIALEVDNIDDVYEKLKEKGVHFFSHVETSTNNKKLCYFLGPDSIIIELAEYL